MSTFFDAVILGALQGVTEFLPVSSSGHLVLIKHVIGNQVLDSVLFDIGLHLATTVAIVAYFWKDILNLIEAFFKMMIGSGDAVPKVDRVLIYSIVLGTIPAGFIGFFFASMIEENLRYNGTVAIALLAGSLLFYFAEKCGKQDTELTIKKGVGVGFFQILALMPGFSRSGATISGGLILGLTREQAARFSFLLSIPVILGAGLKAFFDITRDGVTQDLLIATAVGSVTAIVVGFYAIKFLMKFVKTHTLMPFVWYRVALAVVILATLWV